MPLVRVLTFCGLLFTTVQNYSRQESSIERGGGTEGMRERRKEMGRGGEWVEGKEGGEGVGKKEWGRMREGGRGGRRKGGRRRGREEGMGEEERVGK